MKRNDHELTVAVQNGHVAETRRLLEDGALPISVRSAQRMMRTAMEFEVKDNNTGKQTETIKLLAQAVAQKWEDRGEAKRILGGACNSAKYFGREDLLGFLSKQLNIVVPPPPIDAESATVLQGPLKPLKPISYRKRDKSPT